MIPMNESEYMDVALMPTTESFLQFLSLHAGANAPLGQFGFYPGARGEILTAEMAKKVPGTEKWIGHPVFDGNGLTERFAGQTVYGAHCDRLQYNFDRWCAGHTGENIDEMVQMPGAAVFRKNAEGRLDRVGYLYTREGTEGKWMIFVCDDADKGLELIPMDETWNTWGLMSIALRYNVPGDYTKKEPVCGPGEPYAYVWSSVLNFRSGEDNHLITSVPNGTKVRLTGRTKENWTEAMTGDGTVGWFFTKFLNKFNVTEG